MTEIHVNNISNDDILMCVMEYTDSISSCKKEINNEYYIVVLSISRISFALLNNLNVALQFKNYYLKEVFISLTGTLKLRVEKGQV